MKLFKVMKDGGPESKSTGLFLIEIKSLFSIVLLKFGDGSRDAFHSHAFNSVSWLLKGKLLEITMDSEVNSYKASWKPIKTFRKTFHKVLSYGNSYVITFRGPWADRWHEFLPGKQEAITLTHGRKVIGK